MHASSFFAGGVHGLQLVALGVCCPRLRARVRSCMGAEQEYFYCESAGELLVIRRPVTAPLLRPVCLLFFSITLEAPDAGARVQARTYACSCSRGLDRSVGSASMRVRVDRAHLRFYASDTTCSSTKVALWSACAQTRVRVAQARAIRARAFAHLHEYIWARAHSHALTRMYIRMRTIEPVHLNPYI
eukprot:2824412-Pleurochrysis_carterae.AAC.3